MYREREKEREREKNREKIKVFFQFFVKKRTPAEKIKKKAQGCGALVPWYQGSHLSAKVARISVHGFHLHLVHITMTVV